MAFLQKELGEDYTVEVVGNDIRFVCADENYDNAFPVTVLVAMHKTGKLMEMFIIPNIIPI
jgi:hypothetical protein